jgi:hypothetical protein
VETTSQLSRPLRSRAVISNGVIRNECCCITRNVVSDHGVSFHLLTLAPLLLTSVTVVVETLVVVVIDVVRFASFLGQVVFVRHASR